jgi:hypothetical protein
MTIAHPRTIRRERSGVTARARINVVIATTFVVLAASLLATAPAHAAPGDLDPSFSGDGIVLTGFGGEIDVSLTGSIIAQRTGRLADTCDPPWTWSRSSWRFQRPSGAGAG